MMQNTTLAIAAMALALGCGGGPGSSATDAGGPTDGNAPLDCASLVACAATCGTDSACVDGCVASASAEAVLEIRALGACADGAGCNEDDACIAAHCPAEVQACGLSVPPLADAGVPDAGTTDAFPARITGTTHDATPATGLDSNGTVVFVRDDAAGEAAGFPITRLAFYRLESITYRATWMTASAGCTSMADETETFEDAPALENYLVIEREAATDGLHPYHLGTSFTVRHDQGLVTTCPAPIGTTYGLFNSEHHCGSGTTEPHTDLQSFTGSATVSLRDLSWDLHRAD